LPFDNLSDDKSRQYFANGMTEDIITDLSKISGLFVIARNSSFKYRGGGLDVKQIARELGVRYVLEGSVRRVGDRVRINAQLIDAATNSHLWADRYDGDIQDVFALQDQVTAKIISALAVKLTVGDQARSARQDTRNVAAHDDFLKGWAHYLQTTPEAFAKAIPFLEKAVARDPNYAKANATLAAIYFSMQFNSWNELFGLTPDDAQERGLAYLDKASASTIPAPLAHQVRSTYLTNNREYDAAIAEADKAIALDANDPAGFVAKTRALVFAGQPKRALEMITKSMRVDPNFSADDLYLRGMALFGLKEYANAEASLDRARRLAPEHPEILNLLVAVYGYLGRPKDAAPIIAKLKTLSKDRVFRDDMLRLSVDDVTFLQTGKKAIPTITTRACAAVDCRNSSPNGTSTAPTG
jgi:TolB-like protein